MRKIIFQNMISVDGFFEGPNRDISWHNVDAEFNDLAIEFLNSIDLLVFGRVTYDLMAGYWPTKDAIGDDPIIAAKMNSLAKIVVSRTMQKADWNNTRLINDIAEIKKAKEQPGKDIAIFGSSDLALSLIKDGLIDEFRVIVAPVILGSGKTLLQGISDKLDLKLLNTKTFKSGNVLLSYEKR